MADTETPTAPPSRPPLTAGTIIAVTVLALAAAVGVFLVLDGGDDQPRAEGSIDLTPAEEAEVELAEALLISYQDLSTGDVGGSVSDFLDKPVVLNFFASTCAPCVAEMPEFEEVHQELGDEVNFVGLAVQDRRPDALDLVDLTGVTYAVGGDPEADIFLGLEAINLPTTVFIGADGVERDRATGAISGGDLRDRIESAFGVG